MSHDLTSTNFHTVNQTDAEFANRIAGAVQDLRRALSNLAHASSTANHQFEFAGTTGRVNTESLAIHATAANEANQELMLLLNLAREVGVPEAVLRVARNQPELEFLP